MHIDWKKNEIIFKIVYYGPGLGGKTTNLEYIYSKLNPALRSELISFKTKEDRTLYFDFMQLDLPPINGKKPRFHLYTIPGQVQYGYGRKLVINGADAFVFVADSQKARMDDNLASLTDLKDKLSGYKKSLRDIPWVLQYNKRDLPNCASVPSMQHKLNFMNVPQFEAVATNGAGVFETLKRIIQLSMSQN
jgi:signal recognition particle receptor subunit beta